MKKILSALQMAEKSIIVVTFVIMALASFAQVVNRNITHLPISWLEELARYSMVYMALLAAEVGLRDGTQISVTVFTDKTSGVFKKILAVVSKLVVILFAVICFMTSFTVLDTQIRSGQISPGLKLPMYIPYAALPLSFGIISVTQIANLILMLVKKEDKGGEAA